MTARKTTIADVARAAGVSTATVSRIINGTTNKASKATRERIQKLIDEMGYQPIQLGRALSRMESDTVALLTPDTRNAFYASIADGLEQAINATGKAMILCHTREDPDVQDRYLRQMESHGVAGIALLGAVPSPGLSDAVKRNLPLVFVNRKCPHPNHHAFVGIDNYSAGCDVARHFLTCDYLPIAAIHGPLNSSASLERYEGFRDTMEAANKPLPDNLVLEGGLTIESGYRAASTLLGQTGKPRAIFCANDAVAYGVYHRCHEMRLAVPDQIALFGFDDNPLNQWLAPWLSTVTVPCQEIGHRIAHLFITKQVPPRQYLLPYALKIRRSG